MISSSGGVNRPGFAGSGSSLSSASKMCSWRRSSTRGVAIPSVMLRTIPARSLPWGVSGWNPSRRWAIWSSE